MFSDSSCRTMRATFQHFTDFSFAHWVRLQAAEEPDRVHRLFARFDAAGRNEWFAARHARGELGGWLADLDIAWSLADRALDSDPGKAIGLQLRYALLRGILP